MRPICSSTPSSAYNNCSGTISRPQRVTGCGTVFSIPKTLQPVTQEGGRRDGNLYSEVHYSSVRGCVNPVSLLSQAAGRVHATSYISQSSSIAWPIRNSYSPMPPPKRDRRGWHGAAAAPSAPANKEEDDDDVVCSGGHAFRVEYKARSGKEIRNLRSVAIAISDVL